MRLLLDSHTLLWFLEGNASLSVPARTAIEDPGNEKHVSHVTAWEVAVKVSLVKLKLVMPYEELFSGVLLSNGFLTLPANFRHYHELLALPFHHRDPFDPRGRDASHGPTRSAHLGHRGADRPDPDDLVDLH